MSVFSSAPSFVIVLHFRLERPTGDEDSGQSIWREIVSNIPCVDTNLPVFGWMDGNHQPRNVAFKEGQQLSEIRDAKPDKPVAARTFTDAIDAIGLFDFLVCFRGGIENARGVEYTSSAQKLKHCQDEEITADVGETIMKGFGPCLGLYRLRKKIHKFAV